MRELKQIIFGIQAIVAYDRKTGIPYGMAEVVGSGGIDFSGEVLPLQGGASRFAWQNAIGFTESKITINLKEYPSFLYNLALGATPTISDATNGLVQGIANKVGTGLFDAAGKLVRAVSITDKANLKYGKYIAVYNSGGPSLDIYASGSIDRRLGIPIEFFGDTLKITETPLAVAQGADIAVPQLGITLDIATTAESFDATAANDGDSFEFEIVPPAEYFREIVIGRNEAVAPAFGVYMYGERGDDLSAIVIDAFKCKMNGLPHNLTEKSYSESEVTIMPALDGDRGIARFINIIRQ